MVDESAGKKKQDGKAKDFWQRGYYEEWVIFYWVSKREWRSFCFARAAATVVTVTVNKTKEVDILSPDAGSLVVLSLVALHFRRSQSEAGFREYWDDSFLGGLGRNRH
jgi:hypothetical protein